MIIKTFVAAALLFFNCSIVSAAVHGESIHVKAQESEALSESGVKIPKVYVLSQDGGLIFEGEASADQPFAPILEALASQRKAQKVQKAQSARTPAITDLLNKAGFTPQPDGPQVLVTLELGPTIGYCAACEPYYSNLREALDASTIEARWVHLLFEKNDYNAAVKQ